MQIIKAVAYARYSSDKQQESSITVQIAAIRKFCAEHKIQLIREYIDEAQTGTNANRMQFQRMIQDAPDKEFQFVIVHRMDRWARNVDDARYYKKTLAKYGVKMVSAVEEFDETPEGEFFELMSMGMAELYSKKLAREAAAGKMANAREGRVHGGTPLLGYKVKNKYYIIEEKESEIVRIIFDMAAQGYGYTVIRDYLNSNGYRHADGRLFTAHMTDVLRNRKYIGEYVYNRAPHMDSEGKHNNHASRSPKDIIRIPGGMPRIVDDTLFNKVQNLLDSRKTNPNNFVRKRRKYLLSGLLKCAECGKAYCGTISKTDNVPYHIYRCNAKGRVCLAKSVNSDYLEEYIISLIADCLLAPENASSFLELMQIFYIKAHESVIDEMDRLREEVQTVQGSIQEYAVNLSADESKGLCHYMAEEVDSFTIRKNQLKSEFRDRQLQFNNFPEFQPKIIKQKARHFRALLKTDDQKELQRVLQRLIGIIRIGNDSIETTLNCQLFLDAIQPIPGTFVENRNFIARPEDHHRQALAFPRLTVRT